MITSAPTTRRALTAAALAGTILALAPATGAAASTTDGSFSQSVSNSKLLSGCKTTVNVQWSRDRNHADWSVTLNDPYLFKGCRATYQLKFYDDFGNPIWGVQQHGITACAVFDTSCSSNPHFRWSDDYTVAPDQRLRVSSMDLVING